MNPIQESLYRTAKNEFKRAGYWLYLTVISSLRRNPHNTFRGTASEYIRKYGLAKKLRDDIFHHYTL